MRAQHVAAIPDLAAVVMEHQSLAEAREERHVELPGQERRAEVQMEDVEVTRPP